MKQSVEKAKYLNKGDNKKGLSIRKGPTKH